MEIFYQFVIFSLFLFVVSVYLLRNPVYCILSFVVVVAHVVFLLIAVEAEYLAYILAIVYIGAIVVLFLFVIMMFYIKQGPKTGLPPLLILQAILLGGLTTYAYLNFDFSLIISYESLATANLVNNDFSFLIAYALFDFWPFLTIIAAILMLLGIVGSILLTLKKKEKPLLGGNKNRSDRVWVSLHFRRHLQLESWYMSDYRLWRRHLISRYRRWSESHPPGFKDFFKTTIGHDDY